MKKWNLFDSNQFGNLWENFAKETKTRTYFFQFKLVPTKSIIIHLILNGLVLLNVFHIFLLLSLSISKIAYKNEINFVLEIQKPASYIVGVFIHILR